MANLSEQLATINNRIDGLQNFISGQKVTPLVYSTLGQAVVYGCKVTQGSDAADYEITLEGEASGDSDHLNPDLSASPLYPFQQANIASCKAAAFYSGDLTTIVELPPTTGSGRYDIAYIAVGPTGPVFSTVTGSPGSAVKTDFDTNGLRLTPYDSGTDAALPVGALPVARIYVEDDVTGIPNSRIADIRDFEGRLRGEPLTWEDLTPSEKDELIDPAAAAATAVVLADNETFKQEMRTLFWLGI